MRFAAEQQDRIRRRFMPLLCGLLLCCASAISNAQVADNAAVDKPDDAGDAGDTEAGQDHQPAELPTLEFLEFLGQFESDAGVWIPPGNLLMDEFDNFLDVIKGQQADDNQ